MMKIKNIKFQDGMQATKHRKENNFQEAYKGLVMINGELKTAVDLRIYGTSAQNYACLWFNNGDKWASGSDKAGGYGYHRPSEASYGAFVSAGVDIDHFGGRGDSAMETAVELLTKKLHPRRKVWVIKAHG